MAKGVPIQGRNPSGNAQIANVTAEGDLKVQLNGSYVHTVISRAVRTTDVESVLSVRPSNRQSRGCVVLLLVSGITGTFGENEGIRLRVVLQNGAIAAYMMLMQCKWITGVGQEMVYAYPGVSLGDAVLYGSVTRDAKITGIMPDAVYVTLNIAGTFDGGEGIDCEAQVIWL